MPEEAPRATPENQPEPPAEPVSPSPEPVPAEVGKEPAVADSSRAEELSSTSDEIRDLLSKDTPDSAFTAAERLAKLKARGVNLAAKHEPPLFEQLQKHQAAVNDGNPAQGEKYVGYLKYLGAVEGMTDEERQQLEEELRAESAAADPPNEELSEEAESEPEQAEFSEREAKMEKAFMAQQETLTAVLAELSEEVDRLKKKLEKERDKKKRAKLQKELKSYQDRAKKWVKRGQGFNSMLLNFWGKLTK